MSLNEDILKRFGRIASQDRLAHAYLFTGPLESGKTKTALALAQLLNCEAVSEKYFCGECGGCRKISAGNHPESVCDPQCRTTDQGSGQCAFKDAGGTERADAHDFDDIGSGIVPGHHQVQMPDRAFLSEIADGIDERIDDRAVAR